MGPSGVADFFMPLSRRRKQRVELLEQRMEVNDHEVNNQGVKSQVASLRAETKSVRLRKNRQAEKLSLEGDVPALGQHNVAVNEKSFSITPLSVREPSPTIPRNSVPSVENNLRTESKLVHEENARLNAGKTLHPFFSRLKVSSLRSTLSFDETATCQVESLQPCPPIHVTQYTGSTQNEGPEIERMWLGWKFIPSMGNKHGNEEKVFYAEEIKCTLMQHDLPTRLEEDTVHKSLNAFRAASGYVSIEEASPGGTPFHEALKDLLKYMQISKSRTEATPEQSQGPGMRFTFEDFKTKLDLYNSCQETRGSAENFTKSQIFRDADGEVLSLTQNSLWTDLYQPKSSKEVCGNGMEIEFLRNWLHMWQQKMSGQIKSRENFNKELKRDEEVKYDSDLVWSDGDTEIDSDDDVEDDDVGLHNTLLITGPEGCGKSAAIYACAREADFTVIEINASDYRSGTLIKNKFGGAMESHGLKEVPQAGGESPQKLSRTGIQEQDTKFGQLKQTAFKQKRESLKRKYFCSPQKICQEAPTSSQDDHQMDSHMKGKTVILFEDVDKHFEEDKGFLTALVQLSKITKRPIILTSNKREPGLPQLLEKCRIDLNYPTAQELVFHACMVCIAEGVSCSPWIVERIVDSCQFDLRKVVMALQFWGQGKVPWWQQSILSMAGCFSTSSDDLDLGNKLEIQDTNGLGSPDGYSKISLADMKSERRLHMKGSFGCWKSDARRLFELDVHHLVLPKVVSCSFACPLSLLVAEKISAAASKREIYLLEVAAGIAEEQACVKKSLKKTKESRRILLPTECMGLDVGDDTICENAPTECREIQHSCVESLIDSPVKSVRALKSLAHSRCLVFCESDGDDELGLQIQPDENVEQGQKRTSDGEARYSCAQTVMSKVEDNSPVDVSWEGLEDVEATPCTNDPVTTVKRKRLTKKITRFTSLESLPSGISEAFHGEVPSICSETSGAQEHLFGRSLSLENSLASHDLNARVMNEASASADVLVCAETSGQHLSVQANLDASLAEVPDGFVIDSFDPVKDTWTSLRQSQETLKALMEHGRTSVHVTSSVADLLDVISASDVISGVQTEAYRDAQWSLDGVVSQMWEGNIGHCGDWDVCQETASELVCAALQHSLACLPVEHYGNKLSILSCVLEGAKDAPAVGSFMVKDARTDNSCLSSRQYQTVDDAYLRVHPSRQKGKKARLEDVVWTAVFPRGRLSKSSLVEYSAYLARISQLEELRQTSACRLRTQRFSHCLSSKLSQSDITELLIHSTFRRL